MFHFAGFQLDPQRHELTRDGEPIKLQPRAFALLVKLASSPGSLVTKEAIFADVWEGRHVSESALTSQVKALRMALGDTKRPHRIIQTVHGVGLRLVAQVEREGEVSTPARVAEEESAPQAAGESQPGERPSIAVLPLQQLNPANENSALPVAVPDELITALSKLRWLRVCARGSSFRYRSFETPLPEAGAALGVRYVLSGSLEWAGAETVFRFELADSNDQTVVWRDSFAIPLGEVPEMCAELALRIVPVVEERITREAILDARMKDPASLDAWQAYHLGLGKVFSYGNPDLDGGRDLFARAVAQDPRFARAHAGLAQVNYWRLFQRSAKDVAGTTEAMCRDADLAIELDPLDPFCQLIKGRSHLIRHEISRGLIHLEEARRIAPSYALAYSGIGSIQASIGQTKEAVVNLETALKLSPLDPWRPHMLSALVIAHSVNEDFDKAAETMRQALAAGFDTMQALVGAVTVFTRAGDEASANKYARLCRQRFPTLTAEEYIVSFPTMTDSMKDHAHDAFRRIEAA